ncbi:hypothetical protein CCP3SC15_6070001 [Gammaproteobacteria bacterium]
MELVNQGTNTGAILFPAYEGEANPKAQRHQEDSARLRLVMEKRIHAWLVDPSCLLYDADEAGRQPEPRVLEELIELTRQPPPPEPPLQRSGTFSSVQPDRFPGERPKVQRLQTAYQGLLAGVLGVLLPIVLALLAPASLRFELAVWLIGPTHYWNSGSSLLFRADETAYRELILGTKLIGNNRSQLLACGEEAQAKGAVVSCTVAIPPE